MSRRSAGDPEATLGTPIVHQPAMAASRLAKLDAVTSVTKPAVAKVRHRVALPTNRRQSLFIRLPPAELRKSV